MKMSTRVAAVLAALSVGCVPPFVPKKASPRAEPMGRVAGETPLVIENATSLDLVVVAVDEVTVLLDGKLGHPAPVAPGATFETKVRSGKYTIQAFGVPRGVPYSAEASRTVLDLPWTVEGPSHIVVYEGKTPPKRGAAGWAWKEVERADQVLAREKDRSAKAEQDRCAADLTPLAGASGKGDPSGHWKCVVGGGAAGTDDVRLAKKSDGTIAATVSGTDRNSVWEGRFVGDQVRFRINGLPDAGGTLTLDPSGKVLSGRGATYREARCVQWTMTCTR